MLAVYKKEMRGYFKSPLGYVFIAVILALVGVFYSIYTLSGGYTEYGQYVLKAASTYLVFFIPILTMRIFSEEYKNKTDQLLLTTPVKTWGVVLGKFLAAMTVILIALAITMLQPLTTVFGLHGKIGIATTISAYLALFLLCMSFVSVGIWISSKTENQLVSVALTFAVILAFTLLNGLGSVLPVAPGFSLAMMLVLALVVAVVFYLQVKNIWLSLAVFAVLGAGLGITYAINADLFEGLFGKTLDWLNILTRFTAVFSGTFNFSAIVFFFTFTFFFLFLTVQGLEKKRWN